jgi:divalent metal cation (Fe/Co/Zn/Cd) transporter
LGWWWADTLAVLIVAAVTLREGEGIREYRELAADLSIRASG